MLRKRIAGKRRCCCWHRRGCREQIRFVEQDERVLCHERRELRRNVEPWAGGGYEGDRVWAREYEKRGVCGLNAVGYKRTRTHACTHTSKKKHNMMSRYHQFFVENETRSSGRTHACRALSIPICSTSSAVSRKPAVSATKTGSPPISSEISKMSRVVPGTCVTIAASR